MARILLLLLLPLIIFINSYSFSYSYYPSYYLLLLRCTTMAWARPRVGGERAPASKHTAAHGVRRSIRIHTIVKKSVSHPPHLYGTYYLFFVQQRSTRDYKEGTLHKTNTGGESVRGICGVYIPLTNDTAVVGNLLTKYVSNSHPLQLPTLRSLTAGWSTVTHHHVVVYR